MKREIDTALITVATVEQPYEAYLIKGFLEENGIAAFLQHELFAQLFPSTATGGIKIQVSCADAEKARQLLAERGQAK